MSLEIFFDLGTVEFQTSVPSTKCKATKGNALIIGIEMGLEEKIFK